MEERNDLPADEVTEETDTLPHFLGTAQDYLERYSHCPLCGSNLHFTHVTDFVRNLTLETARCPECGVRARKAMYSLQ